MKLIFQEGGKGFVLYSYGSNLSDVNDITSAMLFMHYPTKVIWNIWMLEIVDFCCKSIFILF